MKKDDRRVIRTRNMLLEALGVLIVQKGYDAITVQDIIDQANVGRSTFYFHFLDKEQLLEWTINQLRDFLKEQRDMQFETEKSDDLKFGTTIALLSHIEEHRDHQELYKATVGKKSSALVVQYIQRMLKELICEEMEVLVSDWSTVNIPQSVAAEFIVNTFLTVLTWWMDQDMPYTAEETDRMFHKLILSGLYGD